jgi:outer membrane receptor protein involved in Fe transport
MSRVPGADGYRYRFTHSPNEIFDPATLNGNGLVVESGWWAVSKPLRNLINHLQLTKSLGRHALTGGVYFSDYTAEDFWYWQNILLEVRDRPRMLDLVLTEASGNDLVSVTRAGFTQFGTVYVNARNKGFVGAHYLHDEWEATENMRLDGGVRYEYHTLSGARENHEVFDLGDAQTLADDQVIYGNGVFRPYDFSYRQWALSVGANYRCTPNLALYGRGSKGFRMPDFDQFRAVNPEEDRVLGKGEIETVMQLEGGFKLAAPRSALAVALFLARIDQLPFDDEVVDPATGRLRIERRFANSTTLGLELEAICTPVKDLSLGMIATLQNPRLRDFTFTVTGQAKNFDGNRVRRIPAILLDFRPSYELAGFRIYGNLRYIGERFVDDANEVTLPDYAELYAGVSRQLARLNFSLNAANLCNTVGLTEGNPRLGQVVGVKQDIYLARPILGRSVTLSMAYSF